ncbi:nucleotidyl transferase AbiEii/AbiGii toxin family protein [Thermosulfurimonas sp. F29]|uniref:nucleotidyl transferase AbiEii/AbiGii toxin family protein n=1 Tax=Thermosulfurimonas sp. F29 TaxID=2867247 RepID=UPI001C82A347|nr:nucleotidyl transferase AbiEii/AbiGii toxin family protein [Thermosulfurimonas sp. F29]MBX6424172.1 nucleotidyl transferase AbiEii/AbiGii toxin family protein [Thermosulfurimonas sp. F29]
MTIWRSLNIFWDRKAMGELAEVTAMVMDRRIQQHIKALGQILKKAREVQQLYPRTFFVLTGETLLSFFYLHHRFSQDPDFVISGAPEREEYQIIQTFSRALREMGRLEAIDINPEFGHYEWVLHHPTSVSKVEVTRKFNREELPCKCVEGLKVESLKGALLGKVEAFMWRSDPKDLVDLLVAYQHYPLTVIQTLEHAQTWISDFRYIDFLIRLENAELNLQGLILWNVREEELLHIRHALIAHFTDPQALMRFARQISRNMIDPSPHPLELIQQELSSINGVVKQATFSASKTLES